MAIEDEIRNNLSLEHSLRMRKMKDQFPNMTRAQLEDLCEHLALHLCHKETITKEMFGDLLGIKKMTKM